MMHSTLRPLRCGMRRIRPSWSRWPCHQWLCSTWESCCLKAIVSGRTARDLTAHNGIWHRNGRNGRVQTKIIWLFDHRLAFPGPAESGPWLPRSIGGRWKRLRPPCAYIRLRGLEGDGSSGPRVLPSSTSRAFCRRAGAGSLTRCAEAV